MDKKQQDIAYFISFCIEQYKKCQGLEWRGSHARVQQVWRIGILA